MNKFIHITGLTPNFIPDFIDVAADNHAVQETNPVACDTCFTSADSRVLCDPLRQKF